MCVDCYIISEFSGANDFYASVYFKVKRNAIYFMSMGLSNRSQ